MGSFAFILDAVVDANKLNAVSASKMVLCRVDAYVRKSQYYLFHQQCVRVNMSTFLVRMEYCKSFKNYHKKFYSNMQDVFRNAIKVFHS